MGLLLSGEGEICANETGPGLSIEIKLSHHLCKVAPYATTDWVFSASNIHRHARQARNTYNILHKVPINATKNKGQRNLTLVRGLIVSLGRERREPGFCFYGDWHRNLSFPLRISFAQ
jgi:hypothetical protein